MKPNTITMTGETNFHDLQLWDYVKQIAKKVETLNKRTKMHTLDIKELKDKIKGKEK